MFSLLALFNITVAQSRASVCPVPDSTVPDMHTSLAAPMQQHTWTPQEGEGLNYGQVLDYKDYEHLHA